MRYSKISVENDEGVATVLINNPPVNVIGAQLLTELREYLLSVQNDSTTKVIVFESANSNFFIAHFDMSLIDNPSAFEGLARSAPPGLNFTQAFAEQLRHQPQVTIVKLTGIARGGGAEFVLASDMCFAAIGRAGLAQCEALMGIVPGGGATQYLTHRIGRNRALEAILGADLYDAETLERYGWINRALPADEIDAFVNRLAHNIAALSPGVIAAAKRAMPPASLKEGLIRENDAWAEQIALPTAEAIIRGALRAGAQTPEGERRLEDLFRSIRV